MMTSALAAQVPSPDALTLVTVPFPEPAPPPSALPDALFWWAPREGAEVAGLGIAAEITARGPARFDEVERRAAELFARVAVVEEAGAPAWTPRLFGGFAWSPGAADAAPWVDFGDAWFVLPRLLYRREAGRAWLSLVIDGQEARVEDARAIARAEVDRLAAALRGASDGRTIGAPSVRSLHQLDPSVWRDRVGSIRSAIADGACEKIVYARRTDVELAQAVDARALLARLDHRHPGCFRFAFRRGEAVFAGASPERLIARSGHRVESEALAGSIGGHGGTAARALLDSRKDRGEQEVVERALVGALSPLCSALDVAPEPEVRQLRDVLHLCTPVRGQLARPLHLLQLAAALHPTPAVGGWPTASAVAWIAANEAPRGWYAGPVGWFDASGDGELAVAIRSGLVAGARVYAFAGAGIVAESDPDAEYAETGLKQRALLDVIGVEAEARV
jgi:isochorismate synthase